MTNRPSRSESTPERILAGHSEPVQRLAQHLRQFVKEVVPEAEERAYPGWHGIGYRYPRGGYFCAIFPRQDTVRLSFERGVLLHDEHGLLRPGGKQVRYVDLAPEDALPETLLVPLLLEAASLKVRGQP